MMNDEFFPGGTDSNHYELQKIKCYLLFIHVYGTGHKPNIYLTESMTREISRVTGTVSHLTL